MKHIIASGPVVIKEERLLVTKDKKDDFYKIPGGTLEADESLENCALRELPEETGYFCRLVKKLSTMELDKRPGTGEEMKISLHHYLAELKDEVNSYDSFNYNGHEVRWLEINKIKRGDYAVAPNILFLIEKGDIS